MRPKEVPFGVKLFKLVATNGDIKWFIANHLSAHLTREIVIDAVPVRWQVEKFHRSFKLADGGRKVPAPQRQCPTQPPNLPLSGVGVAPPIRPPNRPNDLLGAPTAMGTLPAAIAPKTTHPSACLIGCVSPTLYLD